MAYGATETDYRTDRWSDFRAQLERLCKYILRPPIAQDRLTRRADGTLELTCKSIWKDGTRALVLEPHDLLVRLVAAVPPPLAPRWGENESGETGTPNQDPTVGFGVAAFTPTRLFLLPQ